MPCMNALNRCSHYLASHFHMFNSHLQTVLSPYGDEAISDVHACAFQRLCSQSFAAMLQSQYDDVVLSAYCPVCRGRSDSSLIEKQNGRPKRCFVASELHPYTGTVTLIPMP